jgi:hypothetical protein
MGNSPDRRTVLIQTFFRIVRSPMSDVPGKIKTFLLLSGFLDVLSGDNK